MLKLGICEFCKEKYEGIYTIKNKVYNFCGKQKCRQKCEIKYNPEYHKEFSKRYFKKNRAKCLKMNKDYWIKHPERYKEVRNNIIKRHYTKFPRKVLECSFVKSKRKDFIKILGNSCRFCDSKEKVHFHHKTYDTLLLPHKDLIKYSKQLMPLCPFHHRSIHAKLNSWTSIQIHPN